MRSSITSIVHDFHNFAYIHAFELVLVLLTFHMLAFGLDLNCVDCVIHS